jgi:hypothetical protein
MRIINGILLYSKREIDDKKPFEEQILKKNYVAAREIEDCFYTKEYTDSDGKIIDVKEFRVEPNLVTRHDRRKNKKGESKRTYNLVTMQREINKRRRLKNKNVDKKFLVKKNSNKNKKLNIQFNIRKSIVEEREVTNAK